MNQGLEGVTVTLKDASGSEARKVTNQAGNYWFEAGLKAPFEVTIEHEGRQRKMCRTQPDGSCLLLPAPEGTCNFCHSQPPFGGAPGRIFAP